MILITAIVLFLSFTSSIFAMDISEIDNDESILIQNGFPKENIESLTIEDKQELIRNLNEDKSKVQIDSTLMEIDNLAEIEAFMSMSDKRLIDSGADPIKVDESKKALHQLL